MCSKSVDVCVKTHATYSDSDSEESEDVSKSEVSRDPLIMVDCMFRVGPRNQESARAQR